MSAPAPRSSVLRWVTAAALLALSLLYLHWFASDPQRWLSWGVFALPPLLLALLAPRSALARFWAGVLALAWFSHAVMAAWSDPGHRLHAWAALILALLVVFASSWNGLQARFARKRTH